MQYNSTVAKLLAKENITIRHGNYKTAWFDVEKRVLGLPMWKDMGKDVYDLLIGHEVGHALETPLEGWHESLTTLKGCPKSYLNVIEDARIERKVQSRYPGLVGSFTRGYKALSETGFFGDLESYNWSKMDLIDKINIQAKLRGLVDVKFTPVELEFYNRALTTDTWEDVVQLTLDVVAYTDSFKDEEENPAQMEQPNSNGDNDGTNAEQEEETTSSLEKEQDDNEDLLEEDTSSNSIDDEEDDVEKEEEVESNTLSSTEADDYGDMKVSVTDEIYRRSEDSLIELDEHNSQRIIAQDISQESLEIAVIPYDKVRASRKKNSEGYGMINHSHEYKPYIKEIKKSVYFAVKEFEMRKAAYQYSRASTSDSGRIDVNKLWSYKTNDDIFSQVTQLANSKNHGMIMLVDYSGSMVKTMPYVIDQLIHLALFCRQVHIPFDVYGFTGGNQANDVEYTYADGDFDLQDLSMPLLCSSSLNKKDFNESLQALFGYRQGMSEGGYTRSISDYEKLGHTPLDPALLVTHRLIKKFKAKHKVQKMNLVVLSDGASNRNYVYNDNNMKDIRTNTLNRSNGIDLIVDKKIVTIKGMTGTQELLKNIRTRYDVNTIGFFIANNNADFRSIGYDIVKSRTEGYDENFYSNLDELKSKMNKEYRSNRCVSIKKCMGYNEFYILKGGSSMSTDIEEFDIDVGETKNKLATAFKKFSHSKKQSKVLMTKFGKAVA